MLQHAFVIKLIDICQDESDVEMNVNIDVDENLEYVDVTHDDNDDIPIALAATIIDSNANIDVESGNIICFKPKAARDV